MKPFIKIVVFLLVLALLLASCGKIKTGVKGQVYLAECTGAQLSTNCVGTIPYQAKIDIYDQMFGEVKTFETKQDGSFIVALDPGIYYLHPESTNTFPMAADLEVEVTEGKLTEVTINYDTGIR